MDNGAAIQTAQLNPELQRLYTDFLGECGGKASQASFYTSFHQRDVLL
jgi:hypothetical protein